MAPALRLMWTVWLALLAWVCPFVVQAQDLQAIPALSAHVIDQTGTLTAEQSQSLEAKLTNLERTLGSQVVILMVPSTQPEDIAAYAQRVGDTWKIGRKDVGDGLIVLVAKQDRAMRIEVAKALEGAIPDLAAKRIIDGVMTPAFRAGDFAGGLNAAIDHLASRIKGEALPLPDEHRSTRKARALNWEQWLIFALVGIPLLNGVLGALFGRKGAAAFTGLIGGGLIGLITSSLVLGAIGWVVVFILSLAFGNSGRGGWGGPPMGGGWGGGGWGGGSGGGGFSSGGGGDFGGGGASGRW